jgi:hypothetical protein
LEVGLIKKFGRKKWISELKDFFFKKIFFRNFVGKDYAFTSNTYDGKQF